jgi:two-component system phosphate regulon sensor histidine kinase PhoR
MLESQKLALFQHMNAIQRLWSTLPFVIALAVLIFLGWSASLALDYPYDGVIRYDPYGVVQDIDPAGPTAQLLQVEDQVILIDGVLWNEARPLYSQNQAGDKVQFDVLRGAERITVSFFLVEPSLEELITRLSPLLVALFFWLVALGVQAFKPAYEPTTLLFFFFQATAALLIAGTTSSLGPAWTSSLLNFLFFIIGPLAVHFHLFFPQETQFKGKKYWVIGMYSLALLAGIPYLIYGVQNIQASAWHSPLVALNRVIMTLSFLTVIALLVHAYRHATAPGVRGKIRIVVLGGILSFLPLITLILIPDAILGGTVIPYYFMFFFLSIVPLTYGYTIFRYRLIEIERHVNRGATYILVYSILGGFYLVIYALLNRVFPDTFSGEPLINTLVVLILASIIVPLHRQVQVVVDTLFYGGWYDYRFAVTQITQGLEQITELQPLAKMVSERLVTTLHLQDACVFFRDQNGDFTVIDVAPQIRDESSRSFTNHLLPRSSISYLVEIGDIEKVSLRKALEDVYFSKEERELLNTEQDHLWVPILGHGQVQGLMALGPKFGGDIFSGEDLDILRVVARQIGPVIENVHLLNRLRGYAAELEVRVKERTNELHDAKERVETILASVGDGVIVTDLDGRVLIVNPAFEDQSAYDAIDLINQNLFMNLASHNQPELLEEMHQTLLSGQVWRGELVYRKKDGSLYDIQITIAPVRDQSGKMVNYVGSLRDITVQKELDRMKDVFVSDVSHELRTPTTNISLYLELLEYAPQGKRDEYLNILKEQAHQLRKLVEDILDLSRLTMGRHKKVEFTAVDLNSITNQVITAHVPLAEASGLSLDFEPCTELPLVRGEENQLARLITNLISNALRYTMQGGVKVHTSFFDHQVCLWVQDTGMGIDPEDLPHLFERFYRGRRVRQTRIHGTGLGLAIVKEIVDLHEGNIEIQSKVNDGSSICVQLPTYDE